MDLLIPLAQAAEGVTDTGVTDAGADGAEATADTEGDRLAGVRPGVSLGEDGEQGEKQIEHCGLLWLSGTRRPRRRGRWRTRWRR